MAANPALGQVSPYLQTPPRERTEMALLEAHAGLLAVKELLAKGEFSFYAAELYVSKKLRRLYQLRPDLIPGQATR